MMGPRENYLALLAHEETDYPPCLLTDVAICGSQLETFENGPVEGGLDGFGNGWIPTSSAGGQPALDPFIIPLDDVCDWKEKVVFPDLDAFDWQGLADMQLAGIDRNQKVVEYHSWNSIFLRFTHLLGFENALCAMLEEPEASGDLMDAICDYKIRALERAKEYFSPDTYVNYDDVATEKTLFMSPEVYRDLIKPRHRRLNDAAIEMGIIPQQHCCGYCEEIIPDFIEEHSAAWQAAQPSNDLAALLQRHSDSISIIGGYNTQGRPGAFDVTDEEIVAEVDRCLDVYGALGKGYGFFGFFLGDKKSPEVQHKVGIIISRIMERRGGATN